MRCLTLKAFFVEYLYMLCVVKPLRHCGRIQYSGLFSRGVYFRKFRKMKISHEDCTREVATLGTWVWFSTKSAAISKFQNSRNIHSLKITCYTVCCKDCGCCVEEDQVCCKDCGCCVEELIFVCISCMSCWKNLMLWFLCVFHVHVSCFFPCMS